MSYAYDDLLTNHLLSKEAFWGTAARVGGAALKGLGNFGKGMFMAGPLKGAGIAGKALNMAGKATSVAAPIAGSVLPSMTGQQGTGPSASVAGIPVIGGNGAQPGARYASLREEAVLHPYVERLVSRREKNAGEGYTPLKRAINAASYGAFMLPYMSKRVHDNAALTNALNVAGLVGLGATADNNFDRAGLAIMGAGVAKDVFGNKQNHG